MSDENRKPTVKLPAAPRATPRPVREQQDVDIIRNQARQLGTRVTYAEHRLDGVEEAIVPRPASRPDADKPRQPSDAEFDFKATVGAMIAHTKVLEGALTALGRNDGAQNQTLDAQNAGIVIIARELGIEHKMPPLLQRSIPPPAGDASSAPPPPVLGRLERGAKRSQIVQLIIALGILVELLRDVFKHLIP